MNEEVEKILEDRARAYMSKSTLADDRLAQMQADRKQALTWRDESQQLRARLAALRAEMVTQDEPVLTVEKEPDYWSGGHFHEGTKPYVDPAKVRALSIGTVLYAAPQQTRQPLTEDQIAKMRERAAELAALRKDRADFYMEYRTKFDAETKSQAVEIEQLRAKLAAQAEPVAWRDHVEQRIRAWRQRTMNKSGDCLAIDDFMGQESIDDLVDFVCDECADPQPARQPLTDDQVFSNDGIMDVNAHVGLPMRWLMEITRAVERAHGIK